MTNDRAGDVARSSISGATGHTAKDTKDTEATTGTPRDASDAPKGARDVRALVERLRLARLTIACAESLTGGLVTARLIDVPGASDVVRGGIVCYATDLKASLLGVSETVLRLQGPVSRDCAAQMAAGVRAACRADIGLATTGVAGPGADPSAPGGPINAGTVFVAASSPRGSLLRPLELFGDRAAVRDQATDAAIGLLAELLCEAWNSEAWNTLPGGGVVGDDD